MAIDAKYGTYLRAGATLGQAVSFSWEMGCPPSGALSVLAEVTN